MNIFIDKNSTKPLYLQIKDNIKENIYSKKYPYKYKLYSERKLALELGVNRITVIKAYDDLKAEGLIDSGVGVGTYVIYDEEKEEKNFLRKPPFWDDMYNKWSEKNFDDSINRIMTEDKRCISFSAGFPDSKLFPKDDFKCILDNLIEENLKNLFSHTEVVGSKDLIKEIKILMKSRNVNVLSSEIMITSGSQQALDFIVRTFINVDDVILVEEPTFFGAIQLFKSVGARVIGVPMDRDGIRCDILEYLIKKHRPKFIYSIPNFQNPTGITMSLERRYELLKISSKYSIPIIEDDCYGELIYEGSKIPALKALDMNETVIYLSTFSKTISLGLRIGWIIAPTRVISKLILLKQITDLHSNTLSQSLLVDFLREGKFRNYIQKINRVYLEKRDLIVCELENNFDGQILFNKPRGGFYIWCELLNNVTSSKLLKIANKKGISFLEGNVFYSNSNTPNNFFRLNFTSPTKSEIVEGIKLLKESLNEIKI